MSKDQGRVFGAPGEVGDDAFQDAVGPGLGVARAVRVGAGAKTIDPFGVHLTALPWVRI